MNATVSHTATGPVLTLPETLTVPVINDVHREFMNHPEMLGLITVDFGDCNSIDACGVQWLLQIACYLQSAGGGLLLAGVPVDVADTIRTLGAAELLEMSRDPAAKEIDLVK